MADETDLTQARDDDSELVQNLRATLRGVLDERDQERASRMKVEKRSAFKDLGIDPDKGVGKLFYENYDGELTVDAVKATAKEYGVLDAAAPQPDATQQTTSTEQPTQQQGSQPDPQQQAHSAIDAAVNQGGNPEVVSSDPEAKAWEAHREVMSKTGSRDQAMAAHFGAKLQAAIEQGRQQ